MTVPGKPSVEVPPHLAGTVAVNIWRRFLWRILTAIFYTAAQMLISSIIAGAMINRMSPDDIEHLVLAILFLCFAWFIMLVIVIVRTGATPMMRAVGVRWVRYDTGAAAGWASLWKLVLQGLIASFTFGLGPMIICFASMDEMNRTWFDRTLGIVPINTKAGRDTYKTPAPEPEEEPEPVVHPWNATSSAAASLPPVPTVPEKETETVHVPWGSAIPDPSPAAPSVSSPAASAPTPSSDYIGATPWSTSGTGVSTPAPAVSEPPLSFTPPSSSYSGSASTSSHHEDDDDDRTQLGVRYDTARVTFDTGVDYPFGGSIVLGRNPVAPASRPTASLVPVDDPDRTVSKTHVVLTATREGVLVEDLHSTGGTVVVRADGQETPVVPGSPVVAAPGDTVRYGQRSVVING
nr:RDD family protein [uncultured Actinomyces sp.]